MLKDMTAENRPEITAGVRDVADISHLKVTIGRNAVINIYGNVTTGMIHMKAGLWSADNQEGFAYAIRI
jgi:hypothetical protein